MLLAVLPVLLLLLLVVLLDFGTAGSAEPLKKPLAIFDLLPTAAAVVVEGFAAVPLLLLLTADAAGCPTAAASAAGAVELEGTPLATAALPAAVDVARLSATVVEAAGA